MKKDVIVIEKVFEVPVKRLWKALTDKHELQYWFFNLQGFKAEPGNKFQFMGGHDPNIQYRHLCEVLEVVPLKKLSFSWKYEGYPGESRVCFELWDQGGFTRLRLTHSGIGSFPMENPDFALHNFDEGWNQILGESLSNYFKKENFELKLEITALPENVFNALIHKIPYWWSEIFEGSADQTGESFTVRFGPSIFKTCRVDELIQNQIVIWYVTGTYLDIPGLKNKQEWLDTTIVWELRPNLENTSVRLVHLGLNAGIECFEICQAGWKQFCGSLKSFCEQGQGSPFKSNPV